MDEHSPSDFFEYLAKYGKVNSHSRTNCLSWLAFLSHRFLFFQISPARFSCSNCFITFCALSFPAS